MNQKTVKRLLRLYPAAWRERYAEEFLTVLEETPTTWRNHLDILRGAVDAHLHPEWTTPGRWPMNQRRIFRVASIGAILSAILMIVGIIHSHYFPEDATEFSLLVAPLALLPTIIALHTLYREERPRLSWITAVFGLVSLGSFLLVVGAGALLSLFSAHPPSPPAWVTWLFISLFALVGVWQIMADILGWRTGKLPSGLTGIMATSGFSWFIIFLGIWGSDLVNHVAVKQLTAILGTELTFWLITNPVWAAVKQFTYIVGTGLAIWLITHPIWTVWLGVWFWQQPNSLAPQGDLQTN